MNLKKKIHNLCLQPTDGVDMVGFTSIDRFEKLPLIQTPNQLLPGAKSVIVLASQLFRSVTDRLSANKKLGEVSYQNIYKAHKETVNNHLKEKGYRVARFLTINGYPSIHLDGNITDKRIISSIFSFKYAAFLAGLGIIGKSGLLLTEKYGPRVRLCVIITQAPLKSDPMLGFNPCKDCSNICIKACPCGALKEPQDDERVNYDRFLCNAFYSNNGGCSLCMSKCPI